MLPAILMSHRPIDLLVICLGTNDQKHRFGLTAQDVALGIARLVQDALASGAVVDVLVVAPPPVKLCGDFKDMFRGVETRSVGLADQIERFARDAGAHFFDAGRVISVDPLDGIHWSSEAHKALGQALVPVIEAL